MKRGKTEISEITLRKPSSGELRGIQLAELQRQSSQTAQALKATRERLKHLTIPKNKSAASPN